MEGMEQAFLQGKPGFLVRVRGSVVHPCWLMYEPVLYYCLSVDAVVPRGECL